MSKAFSDALSDTPEPHLTPVWPGSGEANTPLNKECEWYCTECHLRVTKSPVSGREFGHDGDCDHHQEGIKA